MLTETTVDPKVLEQARKILERQEKEAEKRRQNIIEKHPHADADTLEFDPTANKYSVEIICTECGNKRRVYTSDLHQVTFCAECAKAKKAESRGKRQAEIKEALNFIRQGQV